MCSFLRLFAIGVAVLFAMDYVAPPGGTGLSLRQSAAGWATVQPLHVVDRAHKGDRLPVTSTTVVTKGAVPAEVTIRETRRLVPASEHKPFQPPAAKPAPEQKIPEGCDPAFSPLAASAQANFSARCLS
jgi:hypothetical protein